MSTASGQDCSLHGTLCGLRLLHFFPSWMNSFLSFCPGLYRATPSPALACNTGTAHLTLHGARLSSSEALKTLGPRDKAHTPGLSAKECSGCMYLKVVQIVRLFLSILVFFF